MSKWYKFAASEDGKTAEVSLYGTIGLEVSYEDFLSELKALGDVEELKLKINSRGGSVTEGNAIFNAIASHPAKVVGVIESLAASQAGIIACACDEVQMYSNSFLMVHKPLVGLTGGNADDLQKDVDLLNQMEDNAIELYRHKMKIDGEEIRQLMKDETWLNADRCIEIGFCDEIIGVNKAAASIALDVESSIPIDVLLELQPDATLKDAFAGLNAELTSANDQLALNATAIAALDEQITSLQVEADESKACIQEMDTTHKAELEEAKSVTDEAVSAKAAELLALQTQDPVGDEGGDQKPKGDFWAEYHAVKDLSQRNDWYAENKHRIGK